MKEIEAKARMANPELVIKNIEALGCQLSESIFQHDWIFLEKGMGLGDVQTGTNVLRIRKTGEQTLLTLKQRQVNPLNKIEYEISIGDAGKALSIIDLLGYEEVAQVRKSRRIAHFRDYEICVDEVEELGSYIEVEKLMPVETDAATENRVQKELFDFLEKLGVNLAERARFGYDILIWQNKNCKNVPRE
jgi:adenylate cyclase, class 2